MPADISTSLFWSISRQLLAYVISSAYGIVEASILLSSFTLSMSASFWISSWFLKLTVSSRVSLSIRASLFNGSIAKRLSSCPSASSYLCCFWKAIALLNNSAILFCLSISICLRYFSCAAIASCFFCSSSVFSFVCFAVSICSFSCDN